MRLSRLILYIFTLLFLLIVCGVPFESQQIFADLLGILISGFLGYITRAIEEKIEKNDNQEK